MAEKNYTFRIGKSREKNDSEYGNNEQANPSSITNSIRGSKNNGRPKKTDAEKKVKPIKVYCKRNDFEIFKGYCDDLNISCSGYLNNYINKIVRKIRKQRNQ